jgi:hypothetical protein
VQHDALLPYHVKYQFVPEPSFRRVDERQIWDGTLENEYSTMKKSLQTTNELLMKVGEVSMAKSTCRALPWNAIPCRAADDECSRPEPDALIPGRHWRHVSE